MALNYQKYKSGNKVRCVDDLQNKQRVHCILRTQMGIMYVVHVYLPVPVGLMIEFFDYHNYLFKP